MTKAAQISTWTLAVLIVTILGVAQACGSSKKLGGGTATNPVKKKKTELSTDGESNDIDGPEEVEPPEVEVPVETGPSEVTVNLAEVKSGEMFKKNNEIMKTFFKLTRITQEQLLESVRLSNPTAPVNQQTPAGATAKLEGLLGQLAVGQSAAEQTPAVVAATTKLAAHFCDALINNPANAALRTQVLPNIDFASTPANLDLAKSAESLISSFWTMGLASSPDMASSKDMLSAALAEIRTSASTTPPTGGLTAANVVMGGCAIVLTSAPVTMN